MENQPVGRWPATMCLRLKPQRLPGAGRKVPADPRADDLMILRPSRQWLQAPSTRVRTVAPAWRASRVPDVR